MVYVSSKGNLPVKLAPHYQHFSNFMRVLTSFAIVLEFLIGFRNSSRLAMLRKCDFRNAELTSRISTLSEKQIFSWVLGRFSIVLEFLRVFRNSSSKLRKIWLLKISTIFLKISFLRVPRFLFRVLDSTQKILQISPNRFYSKTKNSKNYSCSKFSKKFQNLIFESSKNSV